MKRRDVVKGLAFGGVALGASPSLLLSACGSGGSAGASDSTLRLITTPNLNSLDPIWTTAPGTRAYGFMTFDQLVAVDNQFVPRPQMAEGWSVEDDGKTYVFGLREGLKFHDGEPVRAQDCIPSIERWAARDGFGQLLKKQIAGFELIDDRHFRIRLKQPFPLLPAALGKSSAPACLIMPERMARTDPTTQITEAIGSGPFRFLKDEWVSGSHAAWAKFADYVPRKEPPSGLSGGRAPLADRVEWTQIGDASTAMSALQAGEQDYWDLPPPDLIPVLSQNSDIVVQSRLTTGVYYMLQPNHLQPPFDNPGVRRALAMAIDQKTLLRSMSGDPALAHPCRSFFPLDTPLFTEAGSEIMTVANLDQAKRALAEAGYRGEKVVLLGTSDGTFAALGQVIEDLLRRLGMNVELVTLDFASMTQRRTNKGPVDKGGWSLFATAWTGTDILDPAVHPMLRGAGEQGYAGWATDPELETLRERWVLAPVSEQKAIAEQIQVQAYKTLPFIPLGSVPIRSAWRNALSGLAPAPIAVFWNIKKG